MVMEFRWADDAGVLGLPHPEELEYFGYQRVTRHPRWPTTWLTRRDAGGCPDPKPPSISDVYLATFS